MFHSLLPKTGEWRPSYNELSVEALEGEDAMMLEVSFFEEEVFCALSDLMEIKLLVPMIFLCCFSNSAGIF